MSDAGWFAGNALSIVTDSFGMKGDCNLTNSTTVDEPVQPTRRLSHQKRRQRKVDNAKLGNGSGPFRGTAEEIAIDSVNCIGHINGAVTLSNKFGFATWATAHGCKEGGPGAVPGMLCASGIINLVSFVPWIAESIASIIGSCPSLVTNETLPGAYCAADALDMTAAVISFGSWATTFTKDCHMIK